MPSGNAIYTYTGPEESTDVQGQIFLKGQPKHITDQGVIAACAARKDFVKVPGGTLVVEEIATAKELAAEFDEFKRSVQYGETPAKPKKAKSK